VHLQVFIKSELKVGVIYVKDGQYTEEEILDNNEHSPLFDEFLQIIGDKVRLKGSTTTLFIEYIEKLYGEEICLVGRNIKRNSILFVVVSGFDKYKGGLDTVHDLTGLYSVYTHWRGIEIMFHVSTLLPYEKNDPQKVYTSSCILHHHHNKNNHHNT
jgi:RAP1 GTPase activating protein 1